MKICFNYNPYVYYESYKNVLNNVRKYYPTADIFIYFDEFRQDIKKYKEVSDLYNCNFNIRKDEFFYIEQNKGVENAIPRTYEWLMRLKHSCQNTDAEWLLLLEDDVLIKREIKYFPKSDFGTNREFFRPGGGSIINIKKFLEVLDGIDFIKKIVNDLSSNLTQDWMHGDMMLQTLFQSVSTQEKWIELAEPGYYDNTDHAIYHGYKDLHKLG
jgi:hypothetical protein